MRLVYAPARAIGEYGGEVDNWMWPRHTGDFSFLRGYVGKDGKPADYSPDNVPFRPDRFLKIATEPLKEGDFTMIMGYPGRTYRYRLASEITNDTQFHYPQRIKTLARLDRDPRSAWRHLQGGRDQARQHAQGPRSTRPRTTRACSRA